MLEVLGAIGGIVLVDLALSGDNALVIGSVAAGLPAPLRRWAILLGGAGAIVLRILFAIAATLLLRIPLLEALGGLVLLWIAAHLLADRKTSQAHEVGAVQAREAAVEPRFLAALLTILGADATMSLDNVLAVGALARGNLPLLVGG